MSNRNDTQRVQIHPGQRVQLHPGLDRWMMGDRYGTVTKVGRLYIRVHMDRSGHTVRFTPETLTFI